MFSLIIPTMWKSNLFHKSIMEYKKMPKISEIIIINNDPSYKIPTYFKHNKIKILTQKENIFVNPAWNLGVSQSNNENIIIANDDIKIDRLNWVLGVVEKHLKKYDLLGFDMKKTNKTNLVEIKPLPKPSRRPHAFGVFMITKKSKYVPIPDEIKIWYGDDIQFYTNKKRGILAVPSATIEMSKTTKSVSNTKQIIDKEDRPNFKKYIKENKLTLN